MDEMLYKLLHKLICTDFYLMKTKLFYEKLWQNSQSSLTFVLRGWNQSLSRLIRVGMACSVWMRSLSCYTNSSVLTLIWWKQNYLMILFVVKFPIFLDFCSTWLKSVFESADKSGDGLLSMDEVLKLLHKLNVNLSKRKVKQLFRVITSGVSFQNPLAALFCYVMELCLYPLIYQWISFLIKDIV